MTVHLKDVAQNAAGTSLAQNTTANSLKPVDSMNQWLANDEQRDWALSSSEAWRIAERLSGIRAIAAMAVINVEENCQNPLSDEVRSGLGLAMHALASDALDVLRFNNAQAVHQMELEREVARQQTQLYPQVQPLQCKG